MYTLLELKSTKAMKKKSIPAHIRNPFANANDKKEVWRELLKNSKPVSKEEFLERVKEAHQNKESQKD